MGKTIMCPKRQGDLNRLCGIYSVINAISWLESNSGMNSQRLFNCGVRYLENRKKLGSVMLDGMSRRVWTKNGCQHCCGAQSNSSTPYDP